MLVPDISHIISVWDSFQGVEICTDDPGQELRSVRPASRAKTVAACGAVPGEIDGTEHREVYRETRMKRNEKNEGY